MDTSSDDFKALVDIARDNRQALSGIDLETCKQVLTELYRNRDYPIVWLPYHVGASGHGMELLDHIASLYGPERDADRNRREMMGFIYHERGCNLPTDLLQAYADKYWLPVVRKYIGRGDFIRSWEEIRRMYRGFYAHSLRIGEVVKAGTPHSFAGSIELVHQLIDELYTAMYRKGVIKYFANADEEFGYFPRPEVLTDKRMGFRHVKDYEALPLRYAPPGLALIYSMGNECINAQTQRLGARGKKALLIAAYFAGKRKKNKK